MRLIFDHIDFTLVGHLQTLLEAEGIATEIRNAGSSGLAGEIPFTQVYPELWILDDRDEPRARAIVRQYREPAAVAGPDWTCPNCGESVEGIFTECWNCGSSSPVPPAETA